MAREVHADLIVLDLKMQDLDGRAVFQQLRSAPGLGRIPFVFLTASATKADVDDLRELGAAGIPPKPFDAGTLARQFAEPWRRATGVWHQEGEIS